MAVEQRPVDEEQPLLRARAPAGWPTFGASPRRTAASACRLGTSAYQSSSCGTSALPGPKTIGAAVDASAARRRGRRACPSETRLKTGSSVVAAVRRSTSLHGRWRVADVDAVPGGQRREQALPRERRRAVDREHAARERRQAVLDRRRRLAG